MLISGGAERVKNVFMETKEERGLGNLRKVNETNVLI